MRSLQVRKKELLEFAGVRVLCVFSPLSPMARGGADENDNEAPATPHILPLGGGVVQARLMMMI